MKYEVELSTDIFSEANMVSEIMKGMQLYNSGFLHKKFPNDQCHGWWHQANLPRSKNTAFIVHDFSLRDSKEHHRLNLWLVIWS